MFRGGQGVLANLGNIYDGMRAVDPVIKPMSMSMIIGKTSFRSYLFTVLIGLIFLAGCNQEQVLPLGEDSSPSLQALDVPPPVNSSLSCPPNTPLWTDFQILPAGSYPGFDFVLQILPGSVSGILDSCDCKEKHFCITVNFPATQVTRAAVAETTDPEGGFTLLEPDEYGGYVGFTDPFPDPEAPPAPTNTQTVCVTVSSQNNVLLFDFDQPLPPGTDLNQLLRTITGICIIDDIVSPIGWLNH